MLSQEGEGGDRNRRREEEKRGQWMGIVQRERKVDNYAQKLKGWHVLIWKEETEENRRKGVALSYEFSIGCTFCCRSQRKSRLSTSSLPHFLPLLLPYVLIWQPPAANQRGPGSSFKQRVWEKRRVGTANRNEQHQHHTKQYSPTSTH